MAGAGGGGCPAGGNDLQWCFSQVKGAIDEDVAEADIISTVEFNYSGDLLATGDKGGRVVIFQREQENKSRPHSRGEYNVYSTFQSHEPEFDYLKSLEIEEKINKIRWLPQQNAAHFLLSTNDKTIKLWKISERDKRAEGYNLKDEDGRLRDPFRITALRVPVLKPMDLMVEASPRRVFANAHTYHVNSISVNSDHETYLSADDLRINLWHLEITDRSFNIVDIKPANMEELTEVITAAEFHPHQCNVFVYSSSKGTIRLCDMRSSALCDRHSKFFEEPEDPSSRSFFSEIISSISDVKFSHSGRYMMTRDYLSVKVWDLNMESRPVETHQVHEYLRSKLCSLYENDCIFDKFECCWNGSDRSCSAPQVARRESSTEGRAWLVFSGPGVCFSCPDLLSGSQTSTHDLRNAFSFLWCTQGSTRAHCCISPFPPQSSWPSPHCSSWGASSAVGRKHPAPRSRLQGWPG
uniref:Serine/threonine-protein phosphatase 2A 55 kDa regulatory subunit B n=1 Tax=Equus caballus TaxID=9796 RepID=A0A3Q2HVD7_HORSE